MTRDRPARPVHAERARALEAYEAEVLDAERLPPIARAARETAALLSYGGRLYGVAQEARCRDARNAAAATAPPRPVTDAIPEGAVFRPLVAQKGGHRLLPPVHEATRPRDRVISARLRSGRVRYLGNDSRIVGTPAGCNAYWTPHRLDAQRFDSKEARVMVRAVRMCEGLTSLLPYGAKIRVVRLRAPKEAT